MSITVTNKEGDVYQLCITFLDDREIDFFSKKTHTFNERLQKIINSKLCLTSFINNGCLYHLILESSKSILKRCIENNYFNVQIKNNRMYINFHSPEKKYDLVQNFEVELHQNHIYEHKLNICLLMHENILVSLIIENVDELGIC